MTGFVMAAKAVVAWKNRFQDWMLRKSGPPLTTCGRRQPGQGCTWDKSRRYEMRLGGNRVLGQHGPAQADGSGRQPAVRAAIAGKFLDAGFDHGIGIPRDERHILGNAKADLEEMEKHPHGIFRTHGQDGGRPGIGAHQPFQLGKETGTIGAHIDLGHDHSGRTLAGELLEAFQAGEIASSRLRRQDDGDPTVTALCETAGGMPSNGPEIHVN